MINYKHYNVASPSSKMGAFGKWTYLLTAHTYIPYINHRGAVSHGALEKACTFRRRSYCMLHET